MVEVKRTIYQAVFIFGILLLFFRRLRLPIHSGKLAQTRQTTPNHQSWIENHSTQIWRPCYDRQLQLLSMFTGRKFSEKMVIFGQK